MGYCYDHLNRLCCDNCGNSGGVRRQKCPYGYCQPQALCPACRKNPAVKAKLAEYHEKHCKEASAKYKAEQAARAEALAAGKFIRVAAMNTAGADGGTVVHVIFRNAKQEERGFYMEPRVYQALPLVDVATPEDYEVHGHLLPAPTQFYPTSHSLFPTR